MQKKRLAGLALACGVLLAAGGCLGTDPLFSGMAKIANGKILTLQVAEVQAIALWAEEQAGVEQVPLTDEEAQAVLQFLADNEVNTLARAQYLLDHPQEIRTTDRVAQVIAEDEEIRFLEQLDQAGG
jgi:hypothetical protein